MQTKIAHKRAGIAKRQNDLIMRAAKIGFLLGMIFESLLIAILIMMI